ncbi:MULTISPECIES: ABC transporter ATP-binding protein [Microbacterium]|uniref:ABC transporter ATP-binding protein n=1 Tax=Microbacterium hominis TaxID=162426 RepID=A0A2K9DY12_9MICO|nr:MULTISPECIES: ABC transporter ATP-binding protein [Microbacterium]AUG30754.1 ABC transporter ATP-binding protein [Microbacterium hominis]QOC26514.1 ABC transporter ATP-binding protein [Microbacterium hominis]QOC27687.1 ABC transporter ATP-binding protein [Microbacterium hominis]QYF97178.1 ABC transporter ATP-binding protein [Microbacterium sp. PAMC21962]
MSAQPLLSIRDLAVQYRTRRGPVDAVRGVSFDVEAGSVTALVGESGSGKTTVAQAVIGLLAGNGRVAGGSIRLSERTDGPTELVGLSERRWRHLRGRCIALIPQDPGNSLNPVATIGWSVAEALRIHGWKDRAKIQTRVIDLLERVGIDDPETRARQYPHELSGGMRQRVLIAAALALQPELIIADEPTSALDVTVQRTVLDLLDELRAETGTGILFITHDLAVAADRSDALVVMRAGQVQEAGATAAVLAAPASAYTRTLLADAPSLARVVDRVAPDAAAGADTLVEVSALTQEFRRAGRSPLRAVDDVSFTVARGTTHALVGESGSGKTTTGRSIAGFNSPTRGTIRVGGTEVTALSGGRARRAFHRTTQLVYQNPYASLDPRQSIADILAEPLRNFGIGSRADRADRVAHHLELVALAPEIGARHPRELSGGQRQRVAIARALIVEPELVVLDEAVSALDVTVQAQILRLLARLQSELGLTYVFISHDLAVVRQIADTVSVLRRGRQVEHGAAATVFDRPQHEYTRELLAAIPGASLREETATPPDPTAPRKEEVPA